MFAEKNMCYSFPAANFNYSILLQFAHHGTHNVSGTVLAELAVVAGTD